MIVVDASVVIRWFVREPGHDAAMAVIRSGETLISPDLVIAEVANVLRRKQRSGILTSVQVTESARLLPLCFFDLVPAADLVLEAVELSRTLDHSVYDCLYLACAIERGSVLVTADDVFLSKCHSTGCRDAVVGLEQWIYRHVSTLPDAATLDRILALSRQFEQTLNSVQGQVARPFGSSGMRVTFGGDLRPAFHSPAYVGLRRAVADLPPTERAKILALAWFGRGYSGDDWSLIVERAQAYLTEDPEAHLSYVISLIPLVVAGIRRLETQGLIPLSIMTQDDES